MLTLQVTAYLNDKLKELRTQSLTKQHPKSKSARTTTTTQGVTVKTIVMAGPRTESCGSMSPRSSESRGVVDRVEHGAASATRSLLRRHCEGKMEPAGTPRWRKFQSPQFRTMSN